MKRLLILILCFMMVVASVPFSVSAAVRLNAPKMKKIKFVDTTTFKVSWTKVYGAKKYVLYCKTSGGKFKKLKTLGKNKTSYTHKKLKNNKKYFYKIRAYKSLKNNKTCSRFSNTVVKKCTNYLTLNYMPYSGSYVDESVDATFKLGGDSYSRGLIFYGDTYDYIYNLKGKYNYVSFTYGPIDGSFDGGSFNIISDDYPVATFECGESDLPKKAKVKIDNAHKLEFKAGDNFGWGCDIGIANIKLYK